MKKLLLSLSIIGATYTFQSCDSDDGGSNPSITMEEQVVENYADIVYASYKDSYDLAKILEDKINNFVENPTDAGFEEAKQAWLEAREPYGQTESYRFAGGPIDAYGLAPEGMINAWPLDESFIDYVNFNEESQVNIVNNVADFPEINKELLRDMNEYGGEERSVTIGYHAIEFLLWGQDTQVPTFGAEYTTGGNRPYTDFVDGGTASHQDRRRKYLKIATELLVEDLDYLVSEWDMNGDNYRKEFLAMDTDDALSRIIAGAGVLAGSELAEERILMAVANTSQEDEHSCFSDNTHRDIILNYEGVKNVYLGSYTKLDGSKVTGPSIEDLLKEKNEAKAAEIQETFSTIESTLSQTTVPFDYALTQADDVAKFNVVVNKLRDLGSDLAETAVILEVSNYVAPE